MLLHESFESHAARRPYAVALTLVEHPGERHLTYGELNALANQFAHTLIESGVAAEVRVGLHLPPGVELIAAMIGVLKAGGAYVPLDSGLPTDRLTRIIELAKPAVIITQRAMADDLACDSARLVFTDDKELSESRFRDDPRAPVMPDDLCYVMFTSGSTGAPKGVMVTHGNLVPLFDDIGVRLGIDADDVWTAFHPVSFGYSIWEIWGALRHGGRLVIVPTELRTDPVGLYELVRTQYVTIMSQTPSAFRQNLLSDAFIEGVTETALRCIVLSGEAIDTGALQRWFARYRDGEPRIVNTYAITETAGQLTYAEVEPADCHGEARIGVGRPLAHAELAIVSEAIVNEASVDESRLDEGRVRVPAGEAGELFVGGPSVARGYIGLAEQTAKRFVSGSIEGCRATRWYRTGDRARLASDGALEFLGRTDDQVKLRGYRIEPGEIAAVLREHPAIDDAAVALRADHGGEPRLVGYVVAHGERRAHLPVRPEFWPSVGPYQVYDEFLYDLMSSETERLASYREAFERSVRDRVVLDIGTGEHALLARMCIEAGARKVYAVEILEDACRKARMLVDEQGLADRIHVICGDIASLELPEPIDVCTQGIIGNIGSADGIVPIWNSARRHFAPHCVPVPMRCRTLIAAVELPEVLISSTAFSPVASRYAEQVFEQCGRRFDIRLCVSDLPEEAIISDSHVFEDLDFMGTLDDSSRGNARLDIKRTGRLDGYLVWTVVSTGGDTDVDYRRTQRAWLPVFFPLGETGERFGVPVSERDTIDVDWSVGMSPENASIHPDYRIETSIVNDDGQRTMYEYLSRVDETALNSTPLYRALWHDAVDTSPDISLSLDSLQNWLAARLPEYMVPKAWVELEQLPLTSHHKLDREALPAPAQHAGDQAAPARDDLERDLVDLWQEMLNVEHIGIHDNFFDLGGDSISAVGMTSALQRLLDDAVMLIALFDAPTVAGLARYLREHHEAAMTARYSTDGSVEEEPVDSVGPDAGDAPLSFQQQSFWVLNRLYPSMTGSNEQFVIPLDGIADSERLEDAWNAVLERHEILRTVFRETTAGVRQVILPHDRVTLPVVEFSDVSPDGEGEGNERFFTAAQEAITANYALADGPLINARLYRLSPQHSKLLVNAHHIIADGLSIRIIRDELAKLYALPGRINTAGIPAPATQYRDFSIHQRAESHGDGWERSLEYWRDILQGAPDRTALPTRAVAVAGDQWRGEQRRIGFVIDTAMADSLRELSRRSSATLFMTLLAAFRVLLMRYSGQDDIVIGSPVTSRDTGAMRDMVGCLVNNVVFRNAVNGDESFVDVLSRERLSALAALQHAGVPFERVVETLRPRRRFGEHPLFQILFLYEDAFERLQDAGDLRFGLETLNTSRSSYWDIELSVSDYGTGGVIRGYVGYSTSRFDDEFAATLPVHYGRLLQGIVDGPRVPIGSLALLEPERRHEMLVDWNDTQCHWSGPDTLHERFAAQVKRSPDAVALIGDDVSLSYRELETRVNQLADQLRARGIGPGDLVGIGVGRSVELVTGIIATLMTGAAYVPLDPNYPALRLQFIVAQTGLRMILADASLPRSVSGTLDTIRLDEAARSPVNEDMRGHGATTRMSGNVNDAAYILYTSGSSGAPKGVIGQHGGAVNRCEWMWHEYDFSADDVFCLRTSPNFVDSVWEIFGPLTHGAALRIFSDADVNDPARLVERLALRVADRTVNHIVVVPSLLTALLDIDSRLGQRLPDLRSWITSGEPLRPELLRRFRRACPGATLLNTYGTSEIWDATCFDTSTWNEDETIVPIGKPIAGVRTHVLDVLQQPVPVGVVGELYVGGVGLGAGYLEQPELNATQFIRDPFTDEEGQRLYRTGDLARYRPDGQLECLGRVDRQIKLRGFRIEPDEVAAVLLDHPGVSDACIDLRQRPGGEPILVGYWQPDSSDYPDQGAGSAETLRGFLKTRLPAYMLPGALVEIERMPLTPSGKIDIRALPDPEAAEANDPRRPVPFVPPATETERSVANIWCEILGIDRAGLHDDFFDSGGHSLSATRFLARLRSGFDISPDLAQFFDAPTIVSVANHIDDMRSIADADTVAAKDAVGPGRFERGDRLPLSFAQERLWFLNELDPDSPAYNIAFTIHMSGDLNPESLQSAADLLVQRHEALRTRFVSIDGRAHQEVLVEQSVPISIERLDGRDARKWERRLAKLSAQPFALNRGPLLRLHVLQGDPGEHLLLVVIHHIVSDGLSNGIFFDELASLYDCMVAGREPTLPELPIQYADFALWQRRGSDRPELEAQLRYWTEQLHDAPSALELPTDRPRPAEQMFRGAWLWRELSEERAEALRAFGRWNRCTLFMVLLGAFDVLLSRYSGQNDIVVGSPIAGRSWYELEGMIGLFVNTVALRIDMTDDPTFEALLSRVRRTTLDSQANQDLPFERLVESLRPDRTLSHAPVFQVMFNMTPIPDLTRQSGNLRMRVGRLQDHGVSTFDLTLSVGERADGLDLVFEYDRDLFDRQTIQRIASHYDYLLGAILEAADLPVSALPLWPGVESAALLDILNPPISDPEPEASIAAPSVIELFHGWAERQPEAIAVEYGSEQLTYGELDRRANGVAHQLRAFDIEPGSYVAVCLDRSCELPVVILGILKAGCAYVPLDASYPASRLADMFSVVQPRALVTQVATASALSFASVPTIVIDEDLVIDEGRDGSGLHDSSCSEICPHTDDPAYAVFTSGSTGTPKAVAVTHGNLTSICNAWRDTYELSSADRHLQMASFAFDVFTGDWVRALCSGGTLVLCPHLDLLEPARLYALLRDGRITCAEFVPAVLRGLLAWLDDAGADLSFMRLIAVGSDTWHGSEYAALKEVTGSYARVINSYGTAETTIDSTYFEANDISECAATDNAPVPIGRPFAGSRVYVCDSELRLVPPGVPGELCIGGAGVSSGYVNAPTLTSEKFVEDPFVVGGRLYRTGDRARYLGDGTLVLLGRMDRQIKLRGFRIELGDIEAALVRQSVVAAGAVDVLSDDTDRRLVAWVVSASGPIDSDELRTALRGMLPDYMVPSLYVELDALPITSNGKIDRRHLPAPTQANRSTAARTESDRPVGPIEGVLLELYRDVLGVAQVGVRDSFFDLGGHSLLATQLVSRIRDVLDIELPLRALFDDPTVAGLVAAIGRQTGAPPPPLQRVPLDTDGTAPVSLPQQRMWFLARLEPDSPAYHLHWSVRLTGVLDHSALSRAVDSLVARHDSLRTTFTAPEGEPLQRIAGRLSVSVEYPESSRRPEDLIALPFDLESGPLLRVYLIEHGVDEHILLLVIHHIVADGWSMSVLCEELSEAYNAFRRDVSPYWEQPGASGLPVQYADYAAWQRDWLMGDELERQTGYWRDRLDGVPELLELPTDRPRPTLQTHAGAWLRRTIPADLAASLHAVGRGEHCTLFMVLVAAFDTALARYAGTTDVVIGTPIAGRGRTELEGLIGFFVNTLVLRTSVDGNPTFRELLGRVRQTALDAYTHQDLPFEKLVEILSPVRNRSYNPIVQVLFTVHNQPVNSFVPDGLKVASIDVSNDTAKFDLSVHVAHCEGEGEGELQCGFGYNPDLFDESTIVEIAQFFESILVMVADDVEVRPASLGTLPPMVATTDWSGNLVERFVSQVRRTPQAIAVRTAEATLSYEALNARANEVARQLLSLSSPAPDPDVPRIGLLSTYDERALVGLLGILKAGCAWVPLDPVWPAVRQAIIAADADLAAVVTDPAHLEQAGGLCTSDGVSIPVVIMQGGDDTSSVAADPAVEIDDEALACIIYTSGSTGVPKGVVQTHAGVVIQIGRYSESLRLGPADRLSGLSGYAYDAAIQDIFGALLNGATVCPLAVRRSRGHLTEQSAVVERFETDAITVLHATPSLYRYLLGGEIGGRVDLSSVHTVVLGGEAVRRSDFELYRTHFARGTRFINGLGLTESTVALQFAADHDARLPGQQVPVGTAVAGLCVDLIDEQGASTWFGEIVLTGSGLSPGYWPDVRGRAKPVMDAEGPAAVRSLHTGDFGRRLPDGRIVYMGRRDGQVNVRGYRVELGEIEMTLSGLPGVADSAVRVWNRDDDDWLAAYIVAEHGADPRPDKLRAALADRLPPYMLPQSIEQLDALPRLANGKLARNELPPPRPGHESASAPPRNELEAGLLSIWCDLLQLETLGIHDSFFTLGGHSLLATRVIARIRDLFDTEVPLAGIFDAPTIAGLAAIIESVRNRDESVPALKRVPREGYHGS